MKLNGLNGLNVVTKFPRVNSKYQFNINPSERVRIDVNENSITVAPTISNSGTDYLKSNFDMENTYYFPNNAILSIKEM